ncbi:MAG: hypothetical protein IPO88_16380 [Nannocystis sp.]|uniref:hypothetical protein n=1 Tax=Nannocystis sp. TaxID=1962667 RepID=UPI002422224C|nr:hypothetical protein [Nannocystis sp.]MBK9755046.1 hypothetical protein [Nannocystis sp.]
MTSHFSCIGIELESADDMEALVDRISDAAESVQVPGGMYLVWPGDGPELWLQCDAEDQLIGMTPHFAGPTRMRLGIVAAIERPGQSELDGSFYAWANPPADDPAAGDYPLVFDCPDAAMHDELELPCVATVQLAAFAHHLEIWDSVAEFERARGGDDTQLSSRAFIPAGLLRQEGVEDPPPPVAFAIVNGHVLAAEVRENPLTGLRYQWAALATHGGTLDMVAPMAMVSREIHEGSVISGGFWLSGQIVQDDEDEHEHEHAAS